MSIHSFFCCEDCKVSLWLGKAVFTDNEKSKVALFHIGPESSCPNYKNQRLTMALWKMLADHHGHRIHTYFDYEYDKLSDRSDYREIGGDNENDIPFDEYIDNEAAPPDK